MKFSNIVEADDGDEGGPRSRVHHSHKKAVQMAFNGDYRPRPRSGSASPVSSARSSKSPRGGALARSPSGPTSIPLVPAKSATTTPQDIHPTSSSVAVEQQPPELLGTTTPGPKILTDPSVKVVVVEVPGSESQI